MAHIPSSTGTPTEPIELSSESSSDWSSSSDGDGDNEPAKSVMPPFISPGADSTLVSPNAGERHPTCSVCNAQAYWCKRCKATAYCGAIHQELDETHTVLCATFAKLPPLADQASDSHLTIFFPEKGDNPELRFAKMPSTPDLLYHDLKGVFWEITNDPRTKLKSIQFQLDHVIRLVRIEAAEGKKLQKNKSIRTWGDSDLWRGDVVARSYVKKDGEIKWIDCTLADFRHILIHFRRHYNWEVSRKKAQSSKGAVHEHESSTEEDEPRRKRAKTEERASVARSTRSATTATRSMKSETPGLEH